MIIRRQVCYFVTIFVHGRECLFGGITNGKMILNDAGKIADECWMDIPKHFQNDALHEYIVMPNYVHGIIELVNGANVGVENFQPMQNNTEHNVGAEYFVGEEYFMPLQEHNESPGNEFQKMIPRSIGSIVKGFKIGIKKMVSFKLRIFKPYGNAIATNTLFVTKNRINDF